MAAARAATSSLPWHANLHSVDLAFSIASISRVVMPCRGGAGRERTVRTVEDLVLTVTPVGTLVMDERELARCSADLTRPGEAARLPARRRWLLWSIHYKKLDHSPRRAGADAVGRAMTGPGVWLRLEGLIIADVGLVGLPNAGKFDRFSAAVSVMRAGGRRSPTIRSHAHRRLRRRAQA